MVVIRISEGKLYALALIVTNLAATAKVVSAILQFREGERESGANIWAGSELDVATRLLDNILAHGQAEAHARRFGSEVGLEYPGLNGRRNTTAIVLHFYLIVSLLGLQAQM